MKRTMQTLCIVVAAITQTGCQPAPTRSSDNPTAHSSENGSPSAIEDGPLARDEAKTQPVECSNDLPQANASQVQVRGVVVRSERGDTERALLLKDGRTIELRGVTADGWGLGSGCTANSDDDILLVGEDRVLGHVATASGVYDSISKELKVIGSVTNEGWACLMLFWECETLISHRSCEPKLRFRQLLRHSMHQVRVRRAHPIRLTARYISKGPSGILSFAFDGMEELEFYAVGTSNGLVEGDWYALWGEFDGDQKSASQLALERNDALPCAKAEFLLRPVLRIKKPPVRINGREAIGEG